jgi:MFS superfamily sulfate permease-like transporter
MNVSEPEADTEYSRAPVASRGLGRGLSDPSGPTRVAVAGGALVAGALLFIAEFLPLFEVRTSARHSVTHTVAAGSHHSYGLVPIALLTVAMAVIWWRSPGRLPAVAMVVLAIAALVIAVGRDLPDAQATGIARSGATYVTAAASPSVALYLETAGGVILLLAGVGGLLLGPATKRPVQTI